MCIKEHWFKEWDGYTGPPVTEDMILNAEAKLGYKLPRSYIELLRQKNGGIPRYNYYPTSAQSAGAKGHIEIGRILGISGKLGIDSKLGSQYMISEWGYPDIGVIIGFTPSAGPEAIILDYSQCGPQGEPRVVYVDVDIADEPYIIVLAPDFKTFLEGCYMKDEASK